MEIKSKVYYDISNGNVLTITPELQGAVKETTKEEDFKFYPTLKNYSIEDFDFLELDYGTLSTIFQNLKSYSVNTETKELNLIYYTDSELQAVNQNQDDTTDRVNYISDYLNQQPIETIADFENYIIQNELNKIMEGLN